MANEREHMIEWLMVMNNGYSRKYYEGLTDPQIKSLYEEQVGKKGLFG